MKKEDRGSDFSPTEDDLLEMKETVTKLMKIIENSKVKEKLYVEKLENGLTIMIIPKKGIQKKYVILAAKWIIPNFKR